MQEKKVLNLLSKMYRNMNQWFNKIKKESGSNRQKS